MTDERKEELVTKYAAWIARLYFRSPPVDVSYSESPALRNIIHQVLELLDGDNLLKDRER